MVMLLDEFNNPILNNGKIIDKGPKENMLPKLLDKKVSCRKADYLGGVQNGTK